MKEISNSGSPHAFFPIALSLLALMGVRDLNHWIVIINFSGSHLMVKISAIGSLLVIWPLDEFYYHWKAWLVGKIS